MKIYTKTGDDGTTALFSGARVPKSNAFVEAYGNVDELSSWIGFAGSNCEDNEIKDRLIQIQHDLFVLSSDLACPLDSKTKINRLSEERTRRLEQWIDEYDYELEPLTEFILAGGTELSSRLHLCRTVARRAERCIVSCLSGEKYNGKTLVYLNRLSDLLFILARLANHRAKISDHLWDQNL